MNKYYLIYKPFNVLSQFTKEISKHVTLRDAFPKLPSDVYPIGRLDSDSEGLLILTNDNHLKHNILSPDKKVRKVYLAQVEGAADEKSILKLKSGVQVRIKKKEYKLKAHAIQLVHQEPDLPDRNPPIRERKSIPTSWVKITITEGKNRQIRRMFAAIDFPVLRLIRIGIEDMSIDHVQLKPCIEMSKKEIYNLAGLSTNLNG